MRLGVDGLRLMGHRLGVGRYIEYLLKCWSDGNHPFAEIVAYTPGPLTIGSFDERVVRIEPLTPAAPAAVWEHVVLPLRKPRDDVFFCPGYVVPALSREHPVVVTHLGSYEIIPTAFPGGRGRVRESSTSSPVAARMRSSRCPNRRAATSFASMA
jgi:hypothetical protein